MTFTKKVARLKKDRVNFWIFGSGYDSESSCHIEKDSREIKLKIERKNVDPMEAFNEAFDAYYKIVDASIPEFKAPQIEHQSTADADEIPF